MKKKSLSLLLSGLLTVCLTGVGFASWLIVQGDTKDDLADGTVVVEEVEDVQITIDASWANGNTFQFTAPSNANSGWLRSDTTAPEKLSLTLNVSITNASYEADQKVEISFTPSDNTKYTNVTKDLDPVTEGVQSYLVGPGTLDHSIVKNNIGSDDKYSFTATIAFTWGQFFGGMNPYSYYSDKDFSTYKDEASDALTDMYTNLNGLTFKVVIKTA